MNNIDSVRFNNPTGLSMYCCRNSFLDTYKLFYVRWSLARRHLPSTKKPDNYYLVPLCQLRIIFWKYELQHQHFSSGGGCHVLSELVSKTSEALSSTKSLKCVPILVVRSITLALDGYFPWNIHWFLAIQMPQQIKTKVKMNDLCNCFYEHFLSTIKRRENMKKVF